MIYAKEKIKSHIKPKNIYAEIGDELELISDGIYKNLKTGQSFPALKSLTEEIITVKEEREAKKNAPNFISFEASVKEIKYKGKSKNSNQTSLF